MPTIEKPKLLLVYDSQCPACDYYCRLIQIRRSVGEIELIDARGDHPIMEEITALGFDIDQGMVLVMGEHFYYASEAIHMMALVGTRSGIFNRINYLLFRKIYLVYI